MLRISLETLGFPSNGDTLNFLPMEILLGAFGDTLDFPWRCWVSPGDILDLSLKISEVLLISPEISLIYL